MRDVKKENKIYRIPMIFQLKKLKTKIIKIFGISSLIAKQKQKVEGFCIKKIQLKIKKKIKKKKRQTRPHCAKFTYWIRYNPTLYLSKKSKNARMGSGKGKYVRKASYLFSNQTFLEFRYIKKSWFILFNKYLRNKYGLNLKINLIYNKLFFKILNYYTTV